MFKDFLEDCIDTFWDWDYSRRKKRERRLQRLKREDEIKELEKKKKRYEQPGHWNDSGWP